jgi:hypothetical protein
MRTTGMNARLPLDHDVLDRMPPEVIRLLSQFLDRAARLEGQNAEPRARLEEDSSNSSKPPASDPLTRKRRPPRTDRGVIDTAVMCGCGSSRVSAYLGPCHDPSGGSGSLVAIE